MHARLKKLYSYWGFPVLALWLALILVTGLLRNDSYGIGEPAAHALLLAWSVSERVISTALVMGMPDLRALLFTAIGLYWPGSIIAVKVFTLLVTAAAATLLYRWGVTQSGRESALIGTGLLLIAPVMINQTDSLGTGPYLLLGFALGHWLDQAYRRSRQALGGWFFLQLLLIVAIVSLHPAGLAYPLALLWEWRKNPLDARHQRHVYLGIGISVTFTLLLWMGWRALDWLHNPVYAFGQAMLGEDATGETLPWLIGVAGTGMLLYLLWRGRRELSAEFMPRLLLGGAILGLPAANGAWAMVTLAALLYLGVPRLIAFNQSFGGHGFARQRGLVMTILFLATTLFMQADKAHQIAAAQNLLSPTDQLIMTLAVALEDIPAEQTVVAMSQWPGKTTLAIKRPALPLPPPYPDGDTLMKNIRGVTHLIFDPYDPANKSLAENLAAVSGATETLALQEGGAILKIKNLAAEATQPAPAH
ncbi:MAG: hypothetical protein IT488_02890 [Gammaproteobacteria bacterium]|nr:hypothetical protein [Gammaproteobacteria bacterium]